MKKSSVHEVSEFLKSHMSQGVSSVSHVAIQGEWSRAFSFSDTDGDWIIRFGDHVNDFQRDLFAYTHFASQDLPIPKILEIGDAFDGHFAISEKASGTMLENLSKKELIACIPSLIKLIEAMRNADTSGSQGYGFWDKSGNGHNKSFREMLLFVNDNSPNRRIYGWHANLEKKQEYMDIFEKGYAYLEKNIGFCYEARHVIHSDLLHFNVLVAENKISAVIDWGCGKYGDYLYDVAWLSFWSAWYPTMKDIDFEKEFLDYYIKSGVDVPDYHKRLNLYKVHMALDNMTYCAYRENWDNMVCIKEKLSRII